MHEWFLLYIVSQTWIPLSESQNHLINIINPFTFRDTYCSINSLSSSNNCATSEASLYSTHNLHSFFVPSKPIKMFQISISLWFRLIYISHIKFSEEKCLGFCQQPADPTGLADFHKKLSYQTFSEKYSEEQCLGFCQQRVDPTGLADFQLSQRLLETYPNLSVDLKILAWDALK